MDAIMNRHPMFTKFLATEIALLQEADKACNAAINQVKKLMPPTREKFSILDREALLDQSALNQVFSLLTELANTAKMIADASEFDTFKNKVVGLLDGKAQASPEEMNLFLYYTIRH
jgi:hypothetical protein